MDVFNLLSYVNKISLFAFFITTLIVAYQIYILKKEKTKEQTPTIPDFKEKNNPNVVANFTSLPSSLTKKELKAVNYSKLVFLIILLMTIITVIFVISLINKNNSTHNQALVKPTTVISPTPTRRLILPTAKIILSPSPTTPTLTPTVVPSPSASSSPTLSLSPTDTLLQTSLISTISPTIIPTEIILAQAPSTTPTLNPSNNQNVTDSAPKVLPETGSIEKGLLIIGVAISTIFFSFWF